VRLTKPLSWRMPPHVDCPTRRSSPLLRPGKRWRWRMSQPTTWELRRMRSGLPLLQLWPVRQSQHASGNETGSEKEFPRRFESWSLMTSSIEARSAGTSSTTDRCGPLPCRICLPCTVLSVRYRYWLCVLLDRCASIRRSAGESAPPGRHDRVVDRHLVEDHVVACIKQRPHRGSHPRQQALPGVVSRSRSRTSRSSTTAPLSICHPHPRVVHDTYGDQPGSMRGATCAAKASSCRGDSPTGQRSTRWHPASA